jgi:hypothetical protein
MMAVAHDPAFAHKVGIPVNVGKDFAAADDAAGITKHPTMPKREIRRRLVAEAKRGSPRGPENGLTHAEFERL